MANSHLAEHGSQEGHGDGTVYHVLGNQEPGVRARGL